MTDHRYLPSTGQCHECGRSVTGERKLCGSCAASTLPEPKACGAPCWDGSPCQRPAVTPAGRCLAHRGRKAMTPPKPDPRRPHLTSPEDAA